MWSTTENAPLSVNQTKNEKQIFYEKLEHLIWICKNKSSLVVAAGDMKAKQIIPRTWKWKTDFIRKTRTLDLNIYKNKSSLVAAAGDMNANLAKVEKEIR